MSEDGAGWAEAPGEPHDDGGPEAFHDEPGHEVAWAAEAEPEDFGHHVPDHTDEHGGEPSGTGEHHLGELTSPETEGRLQPDQAAHPADDLLDDYTPHGGEPEEPAMFEPGATLFGWTGEQSPGEEVPSLLIEPGYLEDHYASGWALDPRGDGGILAAQATALAPGGEHHAHPGPGDEPAADPAGPRLDHGLRADVLHGGRTA